MSEGVLRRPYSSSIRRKFLGCMPERILAGCDDDKDGKDATEKPAGTGTSHRGPTYPSGVSLLQHAAVIRGLSQPS